MAYYFRPPTWTPNECLAQALLDKDGHTAMYYIQRGAYPSMVFRGCPVVHHAISMRDEELMKCVVANRADVEMRDYVVGMAPLHFAIGVQFTAGVRILLRQKVDVNSRDWNCGNPPLFYALPTNNRVIFYMLLESGADVNARNDVGETSLHKTQLDWQVKELLKRGADVNAMDQHGRTPLDIACLQGASSIVTELLRWGAVVDEGRDDVVFCLVQDKDCEVELIRRIFRGTRYVSARNREMRTVLHYAAKSGVVGIVRELLECGCDVDARDSGGHTPLFYAAAHSPDIELVSEFIRKGADVNAKCTAGRTPLHFALDVRQAERHRVAKHLLSKGADINAVDNYGNTPLHYVCDDTSHPCRALLFKHSVLRNYASKAEYLKNSTPWRKNFMLCLQCISEIEEMLMIRLKKDFTLYDVALGDKWDFSFTRKIYELMTSDKFPMYSEIVLPRLARRVKEHLSNHANNNSLFLYALSRKSNFCTNQQILIEIVKYMSDSECLNFYIACF